MTINWWSVLWYNWRRDSCTNSYFFRLIYFFRLKSDHSLGTGSYPCPPHGLQRRMRHVANNSPLKGPCCRRASMAYWLQLGVKRQEGGVRGDMACW